MLDTIFEFSSFHLSCLLRQRSVFFKTNQICHVWYNTQNFLILQHYGKNSSCDATLQSLFFVISYEGVVNAFLWVRWRKSTPLLPINLGNSYFPGSRSLRNNTAFSIGVVKVVRKSEFENTAIVSGLQKWTSTDLEFSYFLYTISQAFRNWKGLLVFAKFNVNLWKIWWKFKHWQSMYEAFIKKKIITISKAWIISKDTFTQVHHLIIHVVSMLRQGSDGMVIILWPACGTIYFPARKPCICATLIPT